MYSKSLSLHNFGSTKYQNQVNNLTGALGPTRGAFWNSYTTTTGNPTSLSAQPLYYNPAIGEYVTSYSKNAAPDSISFKNTGTVNFSSSFGRRRKSKRRNSNKKRKSKRKSNRRKSNRRKSNKKIK